MHAHYRQYLPPHTVPYDISSNPYALQCGPMKSCSMTLGQRQQQTNERTVVCATSTRDLLPCLFVFQDEFLIFFGALSVF